MSDTISEFALNMPMIGVSGPAAALPSSYDITAAAIVPPEVNQTECSHINVYIDSATMASYDETSPQALVDIVMNVSITDPTTNRAANYKLVKRLSFDKIKLACEVEHSTPVQVVEDEDDPVEVKKQMADYFAARRVREIAGITESAGTKTFEVKFSHKDKDGNAASGTMMVDKVRGAAHARDVFTVKHAHKHTDAKILRTTEKKA